MVAPKPQFVAAKSAANKQGMEAHLPPHLAELLKKQGTDARGRVEYKANTKRSQIAKTQGQKELDASAPRMPRSQVATAKLRDGVGPG